MSVASSRPIDVLVVGWYPAADAIAAGRFVADQVEALAATGRVRPCVVSFENVPVRGRRGAAQAAAVDANVAASVAVSSPFVEGGAAGAPHVPVARLAAPARERGAAPPDHRGRDRTRSLLALGLADAADQPRWSLVHGHVGYPDGIAAAELAERLAVPYVITEHASFLATLLADPLVRERYRAALRGAARVIAVSRTLAEEVTAIVPELDGRIEVIPNAVAVDDFGHAGAARTGAGGGGGTREPVDGPRVAGELLFVGARRASKGIETLLRAFAAVRAERPDAALRLVGDPGTGSDDDDAWRRLAAELGVGSAVRFEGPTDRSGVAAAMARADLFVHPSPRETFGVVAVEALAAGLPVVAADSGGVTEVLGDRPERLGGLAPRDDAPALAAAILAALGRRDAYDPAVLRAYAAERYAASVVADRLADVYRAVLSERPAARVQPVPEGARAATERVDGSQAIDLVAARTIVVSWSALQLGAAARFPEATFAGATILTAADPGGAVPQIAGASVRLAPPGAADGVADLLGWGRRATTPLERLRRLASRGARSVRAIGRRSQVDDRLLATLKGTLESAIGDASEPPLLVCLSGLDHLVAAPFVVSGRALAAPGGLRWLADARAARQRAAESGASGDIDRPASSDA